MGLFGKKKAEKGKQQPEEKKESRAERQTQQKEYIPGAGGSIVSRSILEGTAKLRWLFRQDSQHGNGWVAFGDTDTQEYVDDAKNMAIVDFNTLANIEPAVVNVFFMPVGSDLELRADSKGSYFVDTRTGEEIREPVKHPAQIGFEKNLKFLNQETYPVEFFESLFEKSGKIEPFVAGETDFPTGEVVLADPMGYLGTKYETVLDRKIPAGTYPVELSLCQSEIAGPRIAAAKLRISHKQAVCYEVAMPKGRKREELGQPGVWTIFGVDAGLACFADVETSEAYRAFWEAWQKEHPNQNIYTDYFAALFRESYEKQPDLQEAQGNFLAWRMPETGRRMVLFSSGMGDGIYSGYWGLSEEGEAVCLVIPFLNPEYF